MIDEKTRSELQQGIEQWFDSHSDEMIDISKQIWEFAEVKFEEFKSSRLLIDVLKEYGFSVTEGVASIPTAFVAQWSNGDGPVIGLIGEYDALPGLGCEIADSYKPTGTSGHGCGHNLLGTGGLAATLAAQHSMKERNISGTIKFFGCPAEEGGGAKVFMVRDGVFDGLDACIGWHPANATHITMASPTAIYSVRFRFHGKASHAGTTPFLGRSALDAALLTDVGVNYLREHVTSSVRMHSVISKGGEVPNIVPETAEIWFYLRAPNRSELDSVLERVKKIANGMAMATETKLEIRFGSGCSSNGLNNKALSEAALKNLKAVGPPQFTPEEWEFARNLNKEVSDEDKRISMKLMFNITDEDVVTRDLHDQISDDLLEGTVAPYSSDSCDVSWQAPYCKHIVACQPIGTGNHSWQQVVCSGMGIGQKGMIVAAKAMALSAINFLSDSELLAQAKQEFEQALKRNPYSCPIPEGVQAGAED